MKHLATSLLVLVSVCSQAQITITDSTFKQFYEQKFKEINIKLYYASLEGKITTYQNDSLVSVYTREELIESGNSEVHTEIYRENGDIIDSFIIIPLIPENDLLPPNILFSQKMDLNNGTVQFKAEAIAPTYTYRMSGIELGSLSLFFCRMEDLPSVLDTKEIQFLNNAIAQFFAFGDFTPWWAKYEDFEETEEYRNSKDLELAKCLILQNYRSESCRIYTNKDLNKISKYNELCIKATSSTIHGKYNWPFKNENVLFFEDINLTKRVDVEDLNDSISIASISIGEFENYTVDTVIRLEFDEILEYQIQGIKIHRTTTGYIVQLDMLYLMSETTHPIYISFNHLKALMPKQDAAIWEMFLDEQFR
ncbi:MAG: hypothetical protein H6607_07785 [Flavobacteriales bacterium]|nr:hypothetical protein [Flavobacteriales bacterium]